MKVMTVTSRFSRLVPPAVRLGIWVGIAISLAISGVSPGLAQTQSASGGAAGPDSTLRPFQWLAADGAPLPFRSKAEIEEFLRTADIVSRKELSSGITRPDKLLLEKDGIRMNAVFRTVNYSKRKWNSQQGPKLNFRDKYIFEVAAYELGKLLGLDNIPPTVLRKIDREEGSLQAWVENAMTEEKRLKKKIAPPNRRDWLYQMNVLKVFDNLVYNDDRNRGNVLIDSNWKIWLIDATRCFQMVPELKKAEDVQYCEATLWERLQSITEEDINLTLKESGLLSPGEIRTLLVRRDKLVEHIRRLIAERGEAGVLVRF